MKRVVIILIAMSLLSAAGCTLMGGATQQPPLTASVTTETRGDRVTFGLIVIDADGKTFDYVTLPNGRMAKGPKAVITDAAGRRVYSFAFRYG
jgi:cytochrome oxidase Cu insertion factor (SCO1/SenC/PrrC family)